MKIQLKIFKSIAVLVLFVSIVSCTPSVKNEVKKWKVNVDQTEKTIRNFPALSGLLKKDLNNSKIQWAEAEKIANESSKAEKMKEINNFFYSGYVHDLYMAKSSFDDVLKKKEKINASSLTKSKRRQANEAINNGNEKIKAALKKLSTPITDSKVADKISSEVSVDIQSVSRSLDRFIKKKKLSLKKKKKKK